MNDFDNLGDTVSAEIDRRKIQKLVEDGIISHDELQNAPIVEIAEDDGRPEPMRVKSVTCRWGGECGRVYRTMESFEQHLAVDHLGYKIAEGEA